MCHTHIESHKMTNISIRNLSKSYGEVEVIPGINLEISDKEFVVLVGPSGCGKTTTLRMIAGLEEATSGEIWFKDKEVTNLRAGLRNTSMVFQNYALYPHMTVAGNIGYGMKVRKVPKAEIDQAVLKAAKILDLEEYLPRRPKNLSGGQRQRVAIGRAIVRDPDIFLFDEPLSNLDAKLRIEMRAQIKSLHRRLQTTIVYVTHDQVEAMTMADRVVVMRDGKIEQADDPITLYENPANIFVASFIGAPSMNFLNGKMAQSDDKIWFHGADGVRLEMPAPQAKRFGPAVGKPVVLGVRPEHTVDANLPNASLAIQVKTVEPLGPHTLLNGTVGTESFTAQVTAGTKPALDQMVDIPIDLNKAHLFDQATGIVI